MGRRTYLPAAGHDRGLALYDPVLKLLGADRARRRLIEQAELQRGHRVLEIGCGTGTLLVDAARVAPLALTGLDPDPNALERARRKAGAARLPLHLDRGFADALPYRDASFDRVFSCFMFHHLEAVGEKRRTLQEVRRVLKPGGRFQFLDFVHPPGAHGSALEWLHPGDDVRDHTEHRLLALLREVGLRNPVCLRRGTMAFVLRLAYFQAAAA
ncbi:MAG TPA: class I SAM-dependent methyltransferase [Vicinamibacterales bacterium]|jgi:ubiquinone/menaquinone biosynthesis C-methylase UbiE|nr:class I SAM-dependent methyltransferase [Vicinamibacterales bacterium]